MWKVLHFFHSFELDQVQRIFPRTLQSFTNTGEQSSNDAQAEKEQNLTIVVGSHRIIGQDKRDEELKEVTQGKHNPIVTIHSLTYLFAKDYQAHIGKYDHHASQSHRVDRISDKVDSMVISGHDGYVGDYYHG